MTPDEILEEIARETGGQRMPGGCDDCDAYQALEKTLSGVYVLTISHDDTCPTYARIERS